MANIAIIGGGIAGVSTAIALKNLNINVTLIEEKNSLVSGPPFCHLHAGGNLYPDITDIERIRLLNESIDFLLAYPYSVDFRPTVIAFPKRYKKSAKDAIKTVEMLQNEYKNIVKSNPQKKVLGEPESYFKLYTKEHLKQLKIKEPLHTPKTLDEWIIPFAKYANLELLQEPIIVVQECGLNMFRAAAGAKLELESAKNIDLKLNTKVTNIQKCGSSFQVTFENNDKTECQKFDFLVNAAGFNSGIIDDILGLKKERLVEFKAAYVTKWDTDIKFPEIIFHGERGSNEAMAQFTPYANSYFQLHGMTKNITLFNDGLAKSNSHSSQPKLKENFIQKVKDNWDKQTIQKRTQRAIDYIGFFLPKYAKEAKVASKPLYGAQQIPGCNISLRATEVDIIDTYARCEIVKVSSAIAMAKEIVKHLKKLNLLEETDIKSILSNNTEFSKIDKLAQEIAEQRGYPKEMGLIVMPSASLGL